MYLMLQSSKTGLCSWGLNMLCWCFYVLLPSVLLGAYVSDKTNKGAYIAVIGSDGWLTLLSSPTMLFQEHSRQGSKKYISGLVQDCGGMRMKMMAIVVVVIITTTMKIAMMTITGVPLYQLTKSSGYLQL